MIWAADLAMMIELYTKTLGKTPAREDFEGLTWGFYQFGKSITAAQYQLCWMSLQAISGQIARWQQPFDAWITPVLGRPPLEIGAMDVDETDVMRGLAPILDYACFTPGQNVTGQPAISLPLAWSKAGLPIGVQFVGRFGEEHLLLQLAAQIERTEPWSKKRPPVYG
jgi:amidase